MIINLHARDDAIVDTVMNRSDSHFARRVVRKIVVDGVQQFDGAPIQAFVPVLVVEKTIDALWPSIVRVALPVARTTGNVTQT